MTVSSETNKVSYDGNDSTTEFSTGFVFLEDSHVLVTLVNDTTGVETTQTITTDYTLTGAGTGSAGTVTMLTAPATGETLIVSRDVPLTQETDYVANDPFPAETHEETLDKLTMIAQQQQEELSRSLRFPLSVDSGVSNEIPTPTANYYLKYNADADAIEAVQLSTSAAEITYENLDINSDIGFGAAQVPQGSKVTRRFDTVAAMVAADDVSVGHLCSVEDYATGNNSGMLFFKAVAAATGTADGGSYINSTGSPTVQFKQNLPAEVSVKLYGAKVDGATDDAAKVQAAIDANDAVIIPAGTCAISTGISIPQGKGLRLLAGATIKRLSSLSALTTPVVKLAGSGAALSGAGPRTSFIQTENKSPSGVVQIGHDYTTASSNVQYCRLHDLYISGNTANGQTSGATDKCVYIANDSTLSSTNYYHQISNLRVTDSNFGIALVGHSNAHTISDIIGQSLGNASLKSAMLYMNGATDCSISTFFLTGSSGTTMMMFEDQIADDASVLRSTHNSLTGMVCEQGGSGLWLEANSATTGVSNFIQGVANTGSVYDVSDDFYDSNTIMQGDFPSMRGIKFPPGTPTVSADANTLDYYEEGDFTPTIQDTTKSDAEGQTYSAQHGRYTRIGNKVFGEGRITITSVGTLGVGELAYLAGLPFTSRNDANERGSLTVAFADSLNITAGHSVCGLVSPNGTDIGLRKWSATTGTTNLTISELSDGADLFFTFVYTAA